ncbi:MAG: 3D domain-containing protein [Roseibacillus sp.]|nr:3D domain-containing protein [Roseibacillus sp.]
MKALLLNVALTILAVGILPSCSFFQPASPQPGATSLGTEKKVKPSQAAWLGSLWSSAENRRQAGGFLPAQVGLAVKASASTLPVDKYGRPTYRSESVRHRYVRTTSYSHQENELGAEGRLNAMGTILKYDRVRSAAADWSRYPVGTAFRIKGLPHVYVVDDYGRSLAGTNTIDIYHPTLKLMKKWATRDAEINVIRWGSWEQSANLLRGRTKYAHCALMYYATLAKIRRQRVVQRAEREAVNPSL